MSDNCLREQLQAYINTARPQVERAAFDVLSQAVNAFNDANPEQRARLEYANGALHVRVEAAQEGEPTPAFDDSDLEKVVVELVADREQEAIVAMERLGFIRSAEIPEYFRDENGRPHDLVVMVLPLGKWYEWWTF